MMFKSVWKSILLTLLIILLLSLAAFAEESAVIHNPPLSLKHLDAQIFNNYISTLIRDQEPEMKNALVKDGPISDFKLHEAEFNIATGQMHLKFTVYYKKIDIQGALNFEIRISNGESPQVGAYCLGLEGGLRSSKFLADVALAVTKNMINKRLVGRQFWSDNQPHSDYQVFKNENLTSIVNQAFINNPAGLDHFREISVPISGGRFQAEFKNINCDLFDINTGKAIIAFDFSASYRPDFGFEIKLDDAGSILSKFDFFIDGIDHSWWVQLSTFKITIRGVTPEINLMAQNIIDREINERRILIPIDLPKPGENFQALQK